MSAYGKLSENSKIVQLNYTLCSNFIPVINLVGSSMNDGMELDLHILFVQLLHVLPQLTTKLQHRLLADSNQFTVDR